MTPLRRIGHQTASGVTRVVDRGRRHLPPSVSVPSGSVSLQPTATPAVTARSFTRSVGVCTHASYNDTAYYDLDRTRSLVAELGAAGVRDGVVVGSGFAPTFGAWARALRVAGVDTTVIPGNPASNAGQSAALAVALKDSAQLQGAVSYLEGPNEWDINGGSSWVANDKAWQAEFYAATKADPATAAIPWLGPSMAFAGAWSSWGVDPAPKMNHANLHVYPAGQPPESGSLAAHATAARASLGASMPLMVTEAGYHNAVNGTGQPGVSEAVQADYLLRLLLSFHAAGVARTHVYQLLDQRPDNPAKTELESWFGLVAVEGDNAQAPSTWTLRRKPAFYAVQRLLARLADITTPATGRRSVVASGVMGDVVSVVLPRSDGSFDVALWRSAPLWDTSTKTSVAVAPVTATIAFGSPTRVETHRPSVDSAVTVVATGATNVTVAIDGAVTLIRCSTPA